MTKPTFHLTGFGKFAGVEDNPSKRIIEIIQKDPSILVLIMLTTKFDS